MVVIIYGFNASSFLVLGDISNKKDFDTLRGSVSKQKSTDYGNGWVVSNTKKNIITMFLKTREDASVYNSPAEYDLFLNPEKVTPTKIKKSAKKSPKVKTVKKVTKSAKTKTSEKTVKTVRAKKEVPVMGKDALDRDSSSKVAIQDFISDQEDNIEKFVQLFVKKGVMYSNLKEFLSTIIKSSGAIVYDHYAMGAHVYIAAIRKKYYEKASHISALDITISDIFRPVYSDQDSSVFEKTMAWMKKYNPEDFLLPTRKPKTAAKKSTPVKKTATKKSPAKKAVSEKVTPVKKAAKKTTPVKKAATKKVVKKTPVKKTTAKKVKKTPVKKVTKKAVKKVVAKKTTIKKTK